MLVRMLQYQPHSESSHLASSFLVGLDSRRLLLVGLDSRRCFWWGLDSRLVGLDSRRLLRSANRFFSSSFFLLQSIGSRLVWQEPVCQLHADERVSGGLLTSVTLPVCIARRFSCTQVNVTAVAC